MGRGWPIVYNNALITFNNGFFVRKLLYVVAPIKYHSTTYF